MHKQTNDGEYPLARRASTPSNDLDSPIYPAPVLEVVGADRGLSIRHIDPYLLVTLARWTVLDEGDTYEYYHGDDKVALASDVVKPGETSQKFFRLAIDRARVPQGLSYPVFARVVRNGSGTTSKSEDKSVFVKGVRPGLDERADLGYHDRLLLSLPEDLLDPKKPLTPQRAADGVEITVDYPGKRIYDKVYLYWGTIAKLTVFELDADHASGTKDIVVCVPPATIGTDSGLIPIYYQVFDELENRSGHVFHFSDALHLQAELDPNLLRLARFLVNSRPATTVNYDQDAGKSFAVQVVTPDTLPDGAFIPAGARLVVRLSGVRVDETTIEQDLPDQLVDPGWPSTFAVAEDLIKELIQGSLRITWRIEFPLGTVLASSQSLTIMVMGTIANMPGVHVVQAEAGLIDPTERYITIEYPEYVPYNPNNGVTLLLETVLPSGEIVDLEQKHVAGAPPPPTRFRIVEQADFARFVGLGNVRITYKVDDGLPRVMGAGTQAVRVSDPTFVQFGQRVHDMPRPEIDKVDEHDNLDPDDVIGQLEITLPYDNTFPGDTFEWRLVGTAPNGSTNDSITLNGGTAGMPVEFSLDRRYADVNRVIRLSYSLIRASGGDPLRSEVLVVSVGKPLRDLLRPEVLEASKNPDQMTPEAATAGATIRVTFPEMLPSDKIRAHWTGIDDIGSHSETKDGNSHKVVDFTVPDEVVGANIAPFGQQIKVQYFLIRNGIGRDIPSLILDLLLLPLITLPIPTIEGIGDAPLLDLSRLNGTERTMINKWLFIHRNQRMWMEYSGTYANPEDDYFEATYTNNLVTQDGEDNGILPPTPVDELRKLKDGSTLKISFWVSFGQGSNKAEAVLFRERYYTVQALPGIQPHPFINGTSDTGPDVTVDPLPIENNTTVTVQYNGMTGADRITLRWLYADGTFDTASLDGADGGTVVFNLTAAKVLHRSVNSTVCLTYSILRKGDSIPSHAQTVRINAIPSGSLPQARIEGIAPNGSLNLADYTGNLRASLAKWPLSNTGQRVWMTCSASGVAPLQVLNGVAITAAEALNGLVNRSVSRSWLDALPRNTQITVACEVTFDGSTDRAHAVPFPSTVYAVTYPQLTISTTRMTLNGRAVIAPTWPKKEQYPGNSQTRTAQGGRPPYTYTSRDGRVASVNATTGLVEGMRNGSTTIEVEDRAGTKVTYGVDVSNVLILHENRTHMLFSQALAWSRTIPNSRHQDSWEFMQTAYGPASGFPVPHDSAFWLCQDGGCDAFTRPAWDTRGFTVRCFGPNLASIFAWCLAP